MKKPKFDNSLTERNVSVTRWDCH